MGKLAAYSSPVWVIDDEVDELFKLNDTIAVAVEFFEESGEIATLNRHLKAHEECLQFIGAEHAISIEIEFAEHVSQHELLCLSGGEVHELRPNCLRQKLDLLLRNRRCLILADLPHGFHHLHEVLVARQTHGKVCVVVIPLLLGDGAIVVAAHAIKSVQELFQDLLAGLSSVDEVLVLRHVVNGINVSNGDGTGVVAVDESEGLVNHSLTALGKTVA